MRLPAWVDEIPVHTRWNIAGAACLVLVVIFIIGMLVGGSGESTATRTVPGPTVTITPTPVEPSASPSSGAFEFGRDVGKQVRELGSDAGEFWDGFESETGINDTVSDLVDQLRRLY